MVSINESARLAAGLLSSKSQEFVPSGIASLDSVLNGGYPLSGLILIEEDDLRVYSDVFTKYFLAEGVANADHIFLASLDDQPASIIRDIPPTAKIKAEIQETPLEGLKIAWRYQNNAPIQSVPSANKNSFSHDFDFNSKISSDAISPDKINLWPNTNPEEKLISLEQSISTILTANNLWYGQEAKNPHKNILRICIKNLGSPSWLGNELKAYQILSSLRTLVHNSSSLALVTIPSRLFERSTLHRCEQLSDILISLKSLANNTNKQFSEYSGLMTLHKVSPINSLNIQTPEDKDWAFKLKKKKLIIEKLHLPPESSITDQREQDDYAVASRPPCQLQF